jgi:hypothetical protein
VEAQDAWWEFWGELMDNAVIGRSFNLDALSCRGGFPEGRRTAGVPAETLYETEQIVTLLAIAAALTALGVAATLIWTRPKDDEQVAAATPSSSPPAPQPTQTPEPTVETVASSATDPASALRQLKALHDEGILTDDEYETKRKALTDQL